MRFVSALIVVLATASMVTAETIPVHWGKLKTGSYFVYKGSNAGYDISLYRGRSGGFHIIDVIPGKDPNGKRNRRTYRDNDGNIVRSVSASGKVIKYVPHNCMRVVGTCLFKHVEKSQSWQMRHILKKTNKGFKFEYLSMDSDGKWRTISKGEVYGMNDINFPTRQSVKAPNKPKNVWKLVSSSR